ncbi:hypothetical protein LTR56_005805 [Elasticomyces elasticus]|nr:hypothetical protein LTR56_005805 [Elasticomyces elasticus]KAK4925736.1 hypothetical protein LTR49_007346 [Elasticomyces elasticus]KAK5765068.1 hypothetical protein LTS12_004846 [Elasticomyces elasticus]
MTETESHLNLSTSTLTMPSTSSSDPETSGTTTAMFSSQPITETMGYLSNNYDDLSLFATKTDSAGVHYDNSAYYKQLTSTYIVTKVVTPTVYYYFTTVMSGVADYTYAEDYAIPTTLAPTVPATSYTWSQLYTPVNLGKVYIIVNNLNQTTTSTSTNLSALTGYGGSTEFLRNGTLQPLTRTDVNHAGTVTAAVPSGLSGSAIIAYPTHYFTAGSIFWSGEAPRTFNDGCVMCWQTAVSSAVPQNHYPFPTPTGTTDPSDPRGWLYVMTSRLSVVSGVGNVSSLLAPATINSVLNYCSVTYPSGFIPACSYSTVAAAVNAVNNAGELLTTTVHVTASSTSAPTADAAQVSSQSSPSTTAGIASPSPTAPPVSSSTAVPPTPSTPQVSVQSNKPQSVSSGTSNLAVPIPLSASSASPQADSASEAVASSRDTSPVAVAASSSTGGIVVWTIGSHTIATLATNQQPSDIGSSPQVSPAASATQSEASSVSSQEASESGASVSLGISPYASVPATPSGAVIQPTQVSTSLSGGTSIVPGIVVDSQTIPLGTSVSIDGTTYAVAISGTRTYAVVNGTPKTMTYSPGTPGPADSSSAGIQPVDVSTTVSGSTSVLPGIIVGSQTIPLGSSASISGTVYGVTISGSLTYAVVNGVPTPMMYSSDTTGPADSSSASVRPVDLTTTLSGSTLILPGIVVGSQTVPLGSSASISGTVYSVATVGSLTYAIVNGVSTPITSGTSATGSSTNEIGSYIWAGLGGTPSSAKSTNSLGQTVVPGTASGDFVTLPTGLSSATTVTIGGETLTLVPAVESASSDASQPAGTSDSVGAYGTASAATGSSAPTSSQSTSAAGRLHLACITLAVVAITLVTVSI